MRSWTPERLAEAARARIVGGVPAWSRDGGPVRAVIDSRAAGPGDLFVGLPGEHVDGSAYARGALEEGAWGALVGEAHADALNDAPGVVLACRDPLHSLQALATAWRRALGASVVGVTGSVGKTSTKDLLRAMLGNAGRAVVANERNLNTEIGLPLTVLGAPPGTEVLVLEMGMRGHGQIAELMRIAEPEVGVITALGPVHLEQMGTMEAIAAEKASIIAGLPVHGTAVLPFGEPLLEPHLRTDIETVSFGPGGRVDEPDLAGMDLRVDGQPMTAAHLRRNACAALAVARALGAEPSGVVDVPLSELRGQRTTLPGDVVIVDDCYNANPVSMRAALDDLAVTAAGRRVAVLGDMRELGPSEHEHHEQIGVHARGAGVELLIGVGPLSAAYGADVHVDTAAEAAALLPDLVRDGDTILVKASRGIGLEVVAKTLKERRR